MKRGETAARKAKVKRQKAKVKEDESTPYSHPPSF
jgi:hypothetical protein